MADDAPLIAPLGDFSPPAVEVEPDRIVSLLVTALYERPGAELELFYAAAGNPAEGRPWRALVNVEYRELRWIMSAAAAREVAARIAQDRTLAWAFGDRGRLAALFTETADQAEAAPELEPETTAEAEPAPPAEPETEAEPEPPADPEAPTPDAPEAPPIPTAARVSREQIEFLGTLSVNRYGLYRFPKLGFATEQRGPFYPEEFVEACVAEGFAYFEPSGGSHGSVKITDAGRAAYRALRQAEPLPQAV